MPIAHLNRIVIMVSIFHSTIFYYLLLIFLFFIYILIIIILIFKPIRLKFPFLNDTAVQLKLLNRIATVKDDGTVEFEVPGDAEPESLGAQSLVHSVIDGNQLEESDLQYIPPLQIVMLIVGTRGDVQPFVAIGKRLQV